MGVGYLFRDEETMAGDSVFGAEIRLREYSGYSKTGIGCHCNWDLVGFQIPSREVSASITGLA